MKVLLVDDENLQLLRFESVCKKALPEAEFLSFANSNKAYEETKDSKID